MRAQPTKMFPQVYNFCIMYIRGAQFGYDTLLPHLANVPCNLSVELPSKPELLEVFGRILINSFNIMDNDYQPIGIGLYLAASVFDHSCNPNATIVFQGKGIFVCRLTYWS